MTQAIDVLDPERERHRRGPEPDAPRERAHSAKAISEQRHTRVDRESRHAIGRHAPADARFGLEDEGPKAAVLEPERRGETSDASPDDKDVRIAGHWLRRRPAMMSTAAEDRAYVTSTKRSRQIWSHSSRRVTWPITGPKMTKLCASFPCSKISALPPGRRIRVASSSSRSRAPPAGISCVPNPKTTASQLASGSGTLNATAFAGRIRPFAVGAGSR